MKLDFSKLSKLRTDTAQNTQKSPFKPTKQKGDREKPTNSEKAKIGGFYELESLQTEQSRCKAVYREYQQNIKTSELMQAEILKGTRAGEDIYSLFLKAVKTISLMTGNRLFYSQIEGDIKTIYGECLLHAPALRIERKETQERLARLREALNREIDTDAKERIQRAVKAHEAKIADLESLIQRDNTA